MLPRPCHLQTGPVQRPPVPKRRAHRDDGETRDGDDLLQTNPQPELTPSRSVGPSGLSSAKIRTSNWCTIKRFVRRMTDFDLFVFTSSLTRSGLLAMLRAMTPYYEGPKGFLDELVPNGMPLAFAMAEQNVKRLK